MKLRTLFMALALLASSQSFAIIANGSISDLELTNTRNTYVQQGDMFKLALTPVASRVGQRLKVSSLAMISSEQDYPKTTPEKHTIKGVVESLDLENKKITIRDDLSGLIKTFRYTDKAAKGLGLSRLKVSQLRPGQRVVMELEAD